MRIIEKNILTEHFENMVNKMKKKFQSLAIFPVSQERGAHEYTYTFIDRQSDMKGK